ncbi:hypothetical protein CW748_02915 [Alteromonadales bacterium alter-6D02]|nr:hypothetical protein CW748_02915 [Alteromonadales bacterium alter-6D02]
MPKYQAPSNLDDAQISLYSKLELGGHLAFSVFSEANCKKPTMIIDGQATAAGPQQAVKDVNLASGAKVTMMVADINRFYYCAAPFSFTPQSNEKYDVFYQRDSQGCSLTLRKQTDNGLVTEKSFKPLTYKKPFVTQGPYCEKDG